MIFSPSSSVFKLKILLLISKFFLCPLIFFKMQYSNSTHIWLQQSASPTSPCARPRQEDRESKTEVSRRRWSRRHAKSKRKTHKLTKKKKNNSEKTKRRLDTGECGGKEKRKIIILLNRWNFKEATKLSKRPFLIKHGEPHNRRCKDVTSLTYQFSCDDV